MSLPQGSTIGKENNMILEIIILGIAAELMTINAIHNLFELIDNNREEKE